MPRFIFITGGVVSSLGKGISSSSIAVLLQKQGYSVKIRKMDPYLNIDPGTMNPNQHGEVFVTQDGRESDLDLGHYERFTGVPTECLDNITAGKIYEELLTKERRGDYLGITVQVIPHVTNLIKEFITQGSQNYDFIICEIGGTVGDIEGLPFFEAIRQLGYEVGFSHVAYIHLTLMPYLSAAKEIKTKPTQHSVKELRSIGIQPNILICRTEKEIHEDERRKIGLFCNIKEECVIQALDEKTIYNVPISYAEQQLDKQILMHFSLPYNQLEIDDWKNIVNKISNPEKQVTIGIVGKYAKLKDSYKSIIEAFVHAGLESDCKVKLNWIGTGNLNANNVAAKLQGCDGILVPGGFGKRGSEEKMTAIKYARENNVPFFGICLGMQLAVIEYARNVLGIDDANSLEFTEDCTPIFTMMTSWITEAGKVEKRAKDGDLGGTMRLGHYPCEIAEGSLAHEVFGRKVIMERHRHRYEFNYDLLGNFENQKLIFSGFSPDGYLAEIVELKNHPWFIGCQFHPEFQSTPFKPHPLFSSFVKAALRHNAKVESDKVVNIV